jgi:chromate reductase
MSRVPRVAWYPVCVRITAVLGSLGAKSGNRALLERAVALAPDVVEVVLFDRLGSLPHFDPDVVDSPPPVLAWREAIAASDGLLIACPEYGHSLPGVLKNAIDWVIGTGELERKVVAITASTPAPERGRMGLAALRQTLGAVSATIVGGEPIARGPDADTQLRALLDALIGEARAANAARELDGS